MANVLKIKSRQTGAAGAPGSLARAELAYNEQDNTLYIGHGANSPDTDANRDKKAIAGVGAFVDLASSQTLTNKDLTATTNSFTGASATQAGVVELATGVETNTGTDATRAVTPDGLDDWTGSAQVTTVGTIATGTWSGTALVAGKVPNLSAISPPTANVAMTNSGTAYRITGLAAPTSPNDAARKADVDAAVQGLDVRESVKYAAVADINAPTTSQSAAVWASGTGNGKPDGVLAAAGDRVLLKAQDPATENGIYEVKADGGSGNDELYYTRVADLNDNTDCSANMFFFVEAGNTLADTGWVCTTDAPTLTNLVFAQFSGTGSFTAGNGLDLTGTAFSLDLKSNGGLVIESTEVAVDLGASSITGTLGVADGGTGATSLTAGAVLLGNTASAITQLAKEAAGKILTSEGTAGGDGAVWSDSLSGITMDCGTF